MTNEELAFLRDLRRVMRDHKVELAEDSDWPHQPDFYFRATDNISIPVNEDLVYELKDQGGTRDEV